MTDLNANGMRISPAIVFETVKHSQPAAVVTSLSQLASWGLDPNPPKGHENTVAGIPIRIDDEADSTEVRFVNSNGETVGRIFNLAKPEVL